MCLVGIIRPSMNREYAAVITSTGSSTFEPSSSGIFCGGNHRSHCAASPGSPGQPVRGVDRSMLRTQPPDVVAEPGDRPRPARPARRSPWPACPVLASSSCRTNGSNGVNDVGTAARSYFGGRSEANARSTVDRPIPKSRAT